MSKLLKLVAVVAMTMFVFAFAAPATSEAAACPAKAIAFTASCAHAQVMPLMTSGMFKMKMEENDFGGGRMAVDFYFEPKCLRDPVPCRIATRCVTAMVDCNTRTATCP